MEVLRPSFESEGTRGEAGWRAGALKAGENRADRKRESGSKLLVQIPHEGAAGQSGDSDAEVVRAEG